MTATRNTPENAGRRKLFIVLPNLAIGGAERVAIDLMRSLSRARFEIILVLLSRSGEFLDQVPPDIEIVELKRRSRYSFPRLVLQFALLLLRRKPHTVRA